MDRDKLEAMAVLMKLLLEWEKRKDGICSISVNEHFSHKIKSFVRI